MKIDSVASTLTTKSARDMIEALIAGSGTHGCWPAAARTSSYPGARFRRLYRRFGKQGGGKAAVAVAVAHDLIVIAWHVQHDGGERYVSVRNGNGGEA